MISQMNSSGAMFILMGFMSSPINHRVDYEFDLWWKARQKEMSAVKVAFKITTYWFPVYEMPHGVLNHDGGLL